MTRHVFLTLRIAKQAGPAAIFVCYREVVAQQTGLTIRQVERALYDLERAGWLRLEGRIVWIVNGLKHDPTMRLANPKHRLAIRRALDELPRSTKIVASYCEYYNLEWLSDRHSIANLDLVPPNTEYRGTTRIPSNTMSGTAPDPVAPKVNFTQLATEVLNFLNAKTGRRFSPVGGALDPIVARLRDGATVGECKGVIVQRMRLWKGDDKMAEYLRPKTLFNRTNFAQYRADLPPDPVPTNGDVHAG